MKNENIRVQWEQFIEKHKLLFRDNIEIWVDNLKEVEDYILKHNKLPLYDTTKLGKWISIQKRNYVKNNKIMENENIRKLWKDFIGHF